MRGNTDIDLPEHILSVIIESAAGYPEIERIAVFGSRVLGNAKPGSDIDLALMGKTITPQVTSAFQGYLEEETNIPYLLDIIHFESIENEALREHIMRYGKVFYVKRV